MPHPMDRKHRTRQKILEAAAKLFCEKGFEATTIEDVMRACRLTRGGFYSHFRSKRHLYADAVKIADGPVRAPAAGTDGSSEWLGNLLEACKGRLDGAERAIPTWAHRLAAEV